MSKKFYNKLTCNKCALHIQFSNDNNKEWTPLDYEAGQTEQKNKR